MLYMGMSKVYWRVILMPIRKAIGQKRKRKLPVSMIIAVGALKRMIEPVI